MEPITYSFNKWNVLSRLFPITLSLFFCIYNELRIKSMTGALNWNWVFAGGLIYLIFTIYIIVKYFIPGIRRKIALELNNEKLKDILNNKTICWKDVTAIEPASTFFSNIYFKLKEGEDFSIDLSSIKGRNSIISKSILSYYQNSQKALS